MSGPSGIVLWFLPPLGAEAVLEPPVYLRYPGVEYDREALSKRCWHWSVELDDELSPLEGKYSHHNEADINLIFPHWHAGTLPLASRIRHLFPTAYEARVFALPWWMETRARGFRPGLCAINAMCMA